MRPDIEALAAECSDVSFVGWVSEDEVTDLMRAAEAVLVPSEWYEGLPLVILRSLSVGTPVITSDLENFAEDVEADGVGETFRVGDADALRDALRKVIADPAHMSGMRGGPSVVREALLADGRRPTARRGLHRADRLSLSPSST